MSRSRDYPGQPGANIHGLHWPCKSWSVNYSTLTSSPKGRSTVPTWQIQNKVFCARIAPRHRLAISQQQSPTPYQNELSRHHNDMCASQRCWCQGTRLLTYGGASCVHLPARSWVGAPLSARSWVRGAVPGSLPARSRLRVVARASPLNKL